MGPQATFYAYVNLDVSVRKYLKDGRVFSLPLLRCVVQIICACISKLFVTMELFTRVC